MVKTVILDRCCRYPDGAGMICADHAIFKSVGTEDGRCHFFCSCCPDLERDRSVGVHFISNDRTLKTTFSNGDAFLNLHVGKCIRGICLGRKNMSSNRYNIFSKGFIWYNQRIIRISLLMQAAVIAYYSQSSILV